jgi:hypothetical protein
MTGIATHLTQWLSAKVATGVLIGPGLILLAYRIICLIEIWMILRSLSKADRVTAAVAYLTTRSVRTSFQEDAWRRDSTATQPTVKVRSNGTAKSPVSSATGGAAAGTTNRGGRQRRP